MLGRSNKNSSSYSEEQRHRWVLATKALEQGGGEMVCKSPEDVAKLKLWIDKGDEVFEFVKTYNDVEYIENVLNKIKRIVPSLKEMDTHIEHLSTFEGDEYELKVTEALESLKHKIKETEDEIIKLQSRYDEVCLLRNTLKERFKNIKEVILDDYKKEGLEEGYVSGVSIPANVHMTLKDIKQIIDKHKFQLGTMRVITSDNTVIKISSYNVIEGKLVFWASKAQTNDAGHILKAIERQNIINH